MASRTSTSAAVAILSLLAASPARGQTTELLKREVAAVGVVERLGAAVPLSGSFTDSEGRTVRLADRAGRPLLLSFNYTSCPRLCGLQLGGLARGLKDAGWSGEGFDVATVSIDPAEKQEQMARYRKAMIREAGGSAGAERAWRFLRGSQADVDALAEAVGFKYRYEPRTGEYQHQATLVVITPDGRVSGYLHGITYTADALRTAVDRAASGVVATAAEQRSLGGFLLTCMGFDPADPAPLALKVMRSGGVLAIVFLISFLGYQAYRDQRRRRTENPTP
jgi:protein SCO1/2